MVHRILMKGHTKRLLLVFLFVGILAFPSFSWAASGDPWIDAWHDSEGNTFYVRRFIILNVNETKYNSPIYIEPYFEDEHCWPTTIRIVMYNGTYNELPYVINSIETYGSGYVKNVSLTFVSPNTYSSHYIYYSDNASISAPNYSGKYLTVSGNPISNFYDAGTNSLVNSSILRLPNNGNATAEILIPIPSAGNFTTIDQAEFNMTALTTFLNSSVYDPINLQGAYPRMGPNSIRLYRGDTFPNGQNVSEPYLLVGNSDGFSIYRYKNASKNFQYEAGVNLPQLGSINWTIGGLQISNAHQSGSSRLITFGLSNGTIMFYTYDGTTLNYYNQDTLFYNTENLTDPLNPGIWSKPFAIESSNINTETAFQELFAMAQGAEPAESLSYEVLNFNSSALYRYNYTDQGLRRSIGYSQNASGSNWSALAYSQKNYAWDQFENFFTGNSYNEILYSYIQGNKNTIKMPELSCEWSSDSYVVNPSLSRLKDLGGQTEVQLVDGIAPGLAYSKNLDTDSSTYKIIVAGVNGSGNGGLVIRSYKLNNTHSQSSDFLLVQLNDEIYDTSIKDSRAFIPIVGNFDGINSTYDDTFIVDNLGYYHYVIYNPDSNQLEKVRSASLFGEYRDLYGGGQSILPYDLDGDGIHEILLADSNGRLSILSAYDPTNVTFYSRFGSGADDFVNQTTIEGILHYYNREYLLSGFEQNITNFLGNDTLTFQGKNYSRYSMKFSSAVESDIMILGLNITYSTNDYFIVDVNRDAIGSHSIGEPNYIDLNDDGLIDFFTRKGIFYWRENWGPFTGMNRNNHPTTNVFWNGSWINLNFGQPYPSGFNYSAFMDSNDTDNDGLINGVEMVLYGTDPFKNDTDGDGLSDGEEVLIHGTLPINPDTDDDGLSDGEELLTYGSNPLNNNTNNDWRVVNKILFGLKDGEKVARGLNPLVNDTDGDGIDDMDELGIYSITSSNALKHYSYTRRTLVFYAWDMTYFDILGYTSVSIGGEIQLGLNPTKNDTDSDGMNDREEMFGVNISGQIYTSNPVNNDTDNDGLEDGVELYGWNAKYGNRTQGLWITHVSYEQYKAAPTNVSRFVILDPDNWDTDNDKLGDNDELSWGADPTNPDTARDGLLDGDKVNGLIFNGIIYKLNPVLWDNDGDGLGDAEEYHGRFISSDGINGSFFTYWGFRGTKLQTNPLSKDSDGDGWDDLYELTVARTNPMADDTSGDGIIDSESRYPLLHIFVANLSFYISFIAVGASMVSIVLNQRSLRVLKKRIIQDKDRKQALNRMENERLSAKNFDLKITMIPTDNPSLFKVKLTIKILEESFFAKAAKIYYSALDITNQELECTFLGNETFTVTLNDLPVDTQVLFYLSVLNKSGVWVNDDNDGKLYRFTTSKGGKLDTRDEDDWDVKRGVKCQVCGYLCLKEWDECPNCGSPLQSVLQEVLLDEQQKKEEQRKKEQDLDAIAWEDAQTTDDVWRGLPTCPQCGSAVQPDWASCPICSYNLEGVKLEKKALFADEEVDMDYVEGAEEVSEEKYVSDIPEQEEPKSAKQIKEEMEKKKKQELEKEWGKTDDNIDVL